MSEDAEITFQINGLSCAGCAGRAERALAGVEGVRSAAVNLATSKGQVTAASDLPLTALTEALEAAGYPAAQSQITLQIDGLSCASCVGRVEAALLAVPGVLRADVNLAAERAEVFYLTGAVQGADLARVVTAAGYPARLRGEGTDEAAQESARKADEIRALQRHVLIAAALTLPVFVIEMGGHIIPALHHWVIEVIGQQQSYALQFLLTTLVLIGPGRIFYSSKKFEIAGYYCGNI